jgi:predicted RNA binding protein YcfA (HicA-like mRNA interferase family)
VPLTVRELIRLTEADGWYLVGQRGGHRQYKHPTKRGRVTVPGALGKQLPPGTDRSILRQAGLIGGTE